MFKRCVFSFIFIFMFFSTPVFSEEFVKNQLQEKFQQLEDENADLKEQLETIETEKKEMKNNLEKIKEDSLNLEKKIISNEVNIKWIIGIITNTGIVGIFVLTGGAVITLIQIKQEISKEVNNQIANLTEEQVYYLKKVIDKIREEEAIFFKEVIIFSKEGQNNAELIKKLCKFRNIKEINRIEDIDNVDVVIINNNDKKFTTNEIINQANKLKMKINKVFLLNRDRIDNQELKVDTFANSYATVEDRLIELLKK